jgi:hypothetical protein
MGAINAFDTWLMEHDRATSETAWDLGHFHTAIDDAHHTPRNKRITNPYTKANKQ